MRCKVLEFAVGLYYNLYIKGRGDKIMENEILYGRAALKSTYEMRIEYYLIPEKISQDYTDLMRYGIKIKMTSYFEGGGKVVEMKQINNIFYRLGDAEEFLQLLIRNKVTPVSLRDVVEDYIIESLDKAKTPV